MSRERLSEFIRDIQKNALVTYGDSTHQIKEVNLGAGEWFEIHYYEDGDEINEAFFISHGNRTELDPSEINVLSTQF